MKKVCCVIQRYGLDVNGGAELLARQVAEKLNKYYEIDIITTKAIDYNTWKNEYEADEEYINGVHVLRFPNEKERDQSKFKEVHDQMILNGQYAIDQEEWLVEQGPFCPKLIQYLKKNHQNYEAIILFTYLYYPIVKAIKIAPEKTIVIPFAHNEPPFHMDIIKDVFMLPKAFVFETEEERQLIRSKFNNYNIPYVLGGAGVEVTSEIDIKRFKEKYNLDNYVIYVGRIDEAKNCKELFEYFLKYKEENPSDLKLVLMGKVGIDIPDSEDILSLGFVSDEDKFSGIAGSKVLIMPSKFESLSIVVLEAFTLGVPVLVNGACGVLKGHIDKSFGGYAYHDYDDFVRKLDNLVNNEKVNKTKGKNGKAYVDAYYQWDIIITKIRNQIEYVINSKEQQ